MKKHFFLRCGWSWLFSVLALSWISATTTAAAEDFNLEDTVAVCTSCHGEEGMPIEADIPIIWGQEFYYLYVQLKDYKAGRRANELMTDIAAAFSKDQMKALAQHFADKEWPKAPVEANASLATQGETGLAAGQCSQCHSTYVGDSRVPRLAGQQELYLERTMLEFKNKIRLNSPAKGSLMGSYEDAAIAAMAHNLAGL